VVLYKKEPEYSEEARKGQISGHGGLYSMDPSGRAVNPRVVRSLGLGLDENGHGSRAPMEFKPGYRDGKTRHRGRHD